MVVGVTVGDSAAVGIFRLESRCANSVGVANVVGIQFTLLIHSNKVPVTI